MRVLQINSVCGVGSTGKIAVGLHDVITEAGHECKIAFGRLNAKGVCDEDIIKIGNEYDVKLHAIGTRLTDRHGDFSVNSTKKLINEIKKYNPDIIHLHNIHGYYINIKQLFDYIKEENKPVVWTLHDCWPFTGHCAYFEWYKCDKWKSLCSKCAHYKAYPASIVDSSAKNYAKKKEIFTSVNKMVFVTPSRWLANLVSSSFLGKYPIQTIYNGINTDVFKYTNGNFSSKYKIEGKKIVLGVANSWDERKGMKDLIDLSEMLDADEYQVVIVGVSEKQYCTMPEGIIAIKRTDTQRELVELYSEAYVFVNPTYEDNFPTVNIEALACGTPVITYNTGGSPEAINGRTGIITDEKSPEGIKRAIERLEQMHIEREECVKHSEQFEQKKRFNEYIEIYRTMLND